jgi:Fanconi anemia group M protein
MRSGVTRELSNLEVKVELQPPSCRLSDKFPGGGGRKSSKDFVSSLIDKRLYKQAQELVKISPGQ